MPKVAVATTSQLAADAARDVIEQGGNAVDAAMAASLLSMNTEPGVCALAGGCFITIWAAGQAPVTIDGYVAVPGIDSNQSAAADAAVDVHMAYGGGITTTVGPASVAVPGSVAAVARAMDTFGRLSLGDVLAPSIRAARDGFPLSQASHHYLNYSGKSVFGRDPVSRLALHPDGETLLDVGGRVLLPGLADSLQYIADEGAGAFYEGELARAISDHITSRGGILSRKDLAAYEATIRPALQVSLGDWRIALNPPPAIGGSMLGALLLGMQPDQSPVALMRAALQYRRATLDHSRSLTEDCTRLLVLAREDGALLGNRISGSTVHTSAVDSDGLACAITASSGYGSGEMPNGTGLWLNNCLGELELNRAGLAAGPAGARLPSNMAPTAARNGDNVLAIGSPGADRITSALAQTMRLFMLCDHNLQAAIDAPRVHIDVALDADADGGRFAETLCSEPGADTHGGEDLPQRAFDTPSMYFGGVGAALLATGDDGVPQLRAAADPRRTGAVCVAGRE